MKKAEASPVESQFCLAGHIHSAAGLNTLAFALRIEGPLDIEKLGSALRELCAQEEALRVRFRMDSGTFTREVNDCLPLLPVQDAHEGTIELLLDQIRQAISPEGLPWKASLLRHGIHDHTLLFVAHRCVWDEKSSVLFAARISTLYSGRDQGPSANKAEPQGAAASSPPSEGARHFAAELADAPLEYGFPLQTARPPVPALDSAEIVCRWEEKSAALLSEMATAWTMPAFIVQTAATIYVTAQYAQQPQLVVGVPFDTRPAYGAELSLGSFTSVLPLAVDIRSETLTQFVARLAEQWRRAQRFSGTAFADIVRECGRRSATSAHALYQIAVVDEPAPKFELDGCICSLRALPAPPQTIDLYARWGTGSLSLSFASKIIAREVAASWVESVTHFLATALREPHRLLSELPLVAEETRRSLLAKGNQSEEPAFLQQDLYALITRHCVPGNHKKAVFGEGRSLSYVELGDQVEKLARRLQAARVGAGDLVGICLPRTTDMVVAVLAVLKTGAGYVPLDPAFPSERLGYMAEHARLKRIVSDRELRARIPVAGIETIDISDAASVPESFPITKAAPSAPAYVIYTSGSTGKPKGVAVPRAAVANFILSMGQRPGLGTEDTLCAVTTLSFDIAVLELLAPLAAGGTVVIATEAETRDPRLLIELLRSRGATILQATPVTWHMLCAAEWPGDPQLKALCGGEPLTPSLTAALLPRVGELWNMYGPTETTVWSTCHRVTSAEGPVSVGTPIHNTRTYVLDEHLRLLPPGMEGRLFIGGAGVALGYLHDERLTRERFLADPFVAEGRMYDTGDRARLDSAGLLTVLGRTDFQVKIRGFRIELGEIETQLSTVAGIDQVVCVARQEDPGNAELVAYYVLKPGVKELSVAELRLACGARLPAHMIPSHFVRLDGLPRTPNGKLDRKALPKPTRGSEPQATNRPKAASPKGQIERTVMEVWAEVLGVPSPGINESFFDLGGTSVLAFDVAHRISQRLALELPVLKIFEHPTIAELARTIEGAKVDLSFVEDAKKRARERRSRVSSPEHAFDVAVVGIAGRFPGARDLKELWRNLSEGRETVTFFRREDLDPMVRQQDREDPHYIPARGILEDSDRFDAAFFGITPGEAELMDPQLRVFMEVAWEAFEDAGYVPEDIESPVGVWAGMGNNFYYLYNVLTRPDKLAVMGEIAAEIANEKDHIAPRVSHRLNLRGPSLSVHTACSTGLVVVENAYQALISHQVDMALAGAVDIRTPQKSGQRHEEGGVFSHDGHCRPYDAAATGTMFGEGVGALLLKRLTDAVRDHDTVYAVIKGAAVNHDGARKVSYLAPSVEGHARLIASALALADINPETITYVEGHGTATPIGDPIEVEALTRVYRAYTRRRHYCALGSIKGNFGHATTAAGIAGLLKIILSLQHRKIPPTLHFKTPNPRIDFASSPFFVNNTLLDWPTNGTPRRAAVSSFGFCGTNAHAILEEAQPAPASGSPSRPVQLVLMSARSRDALDALARSYAEALADSAPVSLADAAYTTQVARKRFEYRRCAVLAEGRKAAEILSQPTGPRSASLHGELNKPEVAFMFPGQGAQYINMGMALHRGEPRFRASIDQCAELLAPHLGCDLRRFLFPQAGDEETARQSLNNTYYTQPAIFTISYAIANQLMHWGIKPSVLIGHSIGEFVAATLSGVIRLPDALRLVSLRGRLMRDLPPGSMLSVRQAAEQLEGRLPAGIDLAASNGPQLSVVAGPTEAITKFSEQLTAEGITSKLLHTSHAFHSSMMDPVVETFLQAVEAVPLSSPQIPLVSTVTGAPIDTAALIDPHYWARHLRSPVHFSRAVRVLLADERQVLVECGPRRTLATMALQHRPARPERVLSTMPDSAEVEDEHASLLLALGALWMNGCRVDWKSFHEGECRRRGPVPTYRFQRRRFWIEPGNTASFGLERAALPLCQEASEALPSESTTGAISPGEDPLRGALIELIEQLQGRVLESPDDDVGFMALGLDSLLLTQFARAIRAKLGLEVTFRQLITSHSTLRLLLQALRAQRSEGRATSAETGKPAPTPVVSGAGAAATEKPSTPAQIEMWVCSQMDAHASCAYNDSFSLHLKGKVDEDSLIATLRALPTMHEALRGCFSADGRQFVIAPQMDVMVARHDLSGEPEDRAAQILDELIATQAMTKYDLEHGPLFRAMVVRKARDEWVTIVGAHRTVCDGWSLDVLLSELDRLYSSLVQKNALPKGPQHVFSDFLAHRDAEDSRAQSARALARWRETFETIPPPLSLPCDGQRPAVRTFPAHHVRRTLDPAVLQRARELSRKHNLSVFTVLFASLSTWLHKVSGSHEFTIGVPVAAHPDCGMEDCVGPLANLVPVRCCMGRDFSFIKWCHDCHASLLDARENASVGLGEIIGTLRPVRHPARAPLIATSFTHVQKYPPGKLSFAGTFVDYRFNPRTAEVFELSFSMVESRDSLEISVHANADLFSRRWAEQGLETFEHLLEVACARPDTPIESFDGFSPCDLPARETKPSPQQSALAGYPPFVGCTGSIREPHPDTEAKVAEIFARALGLPAVDLTGDFFASGGTSLAGVSVIRQVNQEFGVALPLSTLFENSSVSALAQAITSYGGELKSTVVELNRGQGTPVFFVCGIALYLSLARRLPSSCFGIYVPAEEHFLESGGAEDTISVPELARQYVEAIVANGPDGPCAIAGVSFGGVLAFEVARQLRGRGKDITSLVLLDALLPSGVRRNWPGWALGHVDALLKKGWRHEWAQLQHSLRRRKPESNARQAKNALLWRALNGPSTTKFLTTQPTYDGRTLIVRAGSRSGWTGFEFTQDLGWGPFLRGPITLGDSNRDHLGILDDEHTAELIRRSL